MVQFNEPRHCRDPHFGQPPSNVELPSERELHSQPNAAERGRTRAPTRSRSRKSDRRAREPRGRSQCILHANSLLAVQARYVLLFLSFAWFFLLQFLSCGGRSTTQKPQVGLASNGKGTVGGKGVSKCVQGNLWQLKNLHTFILPNFNDFLTKLGRSRGHCTKGGGSESRDLHSFQCCSSSRELSGTKQLSHFSPALNSSHLYLSLSLSVGLFLPVAWPNVNELWWQSE